MSRQARESVIREIGSEASQWQEDVQRFDDAAARLLGVNRTDLRCGFLLTSRAMTAKDLADATGLTPGAVTTVIDRLEEAGLARRRADEADRRRVVVELTAQARHKFESIWGPLVTDGEAMMKRYTVADLEIVRDFLVRTREIQARHIARLEAGAAKGR
jgi:DNA-binding MarR family transcriptional regulator